MERDMPNRKTRRRKIALACEPCRERKSRCDGNKPICASCTRRRLPSDRCIYMAENARSASSNEYIRALHHRIRELESGSGPQRAEPESADSHDSVSNEATGSIDVCAARLDDLRSLMPDGEQTLLQNEESPTLPAHNTQTDVSGSTDSPGNITGMGTMIDINGQNQASGQNSEYFGSSSAASLACFLTGNQRRQREHAWTSQKIPSFQSVSDRQIGNSGMESFAQMEGLVLPPRNFADHLLDCFWERVFCLYPFFDRESFQQAYENLWVPENHDSHKLTEMNVGLGDRFNSGQNSIVFNCALNIIFALGCQFSNLPIQDRESFTTSFFLRAKRHIGLDLVDIHSIGVVQTLLIVALFLQSTPYPHRCWNSTGMACRLALGLGLHQANLDDSKDPLEQEIHRRTWHGCVIMDITVSMAYGRPTMTSHLARVPLPGSFDLTSGPKSDSLSLIAFYKSTIQLYTILDVILSDVYKAWDGRSNDTTSEAQHGSLDVIIRLEDQLSEFESSIPSFLNWTVTSSLPPKSGIEETISRQRNVLHSRFLYHKLLLYRPMLTRVCFDEHPEEKQCRSPTSHSVLMRRWAAGCVRAAVDLISLVYETYNSSTTDTWWYNGFYTSTAAMILVMSYSCYQASEIDLPTIDTAWRKAETVLQYLASISVSGRNTLKFLQAMRNRFVSHLKVHSPATGSGNAPPTQVSMEPVQPDLPQPAVDTWQPLSWDEGLSTNELGFLGPFDISEMQSWFPQAEVF